MPRVRELPGRAGAVLPEGNTQTYASVDRDGTITQGGYSTHVVVDEDFVLRVPDGIPYEAAAPLLCAASPPTRR